MNKIEMVRENDDHDDGAKKKIMKLEGQAVHEEDGDNAETTTMTIGAITTMTSELVELPPELLTIILTNLGSKLDRRSCRQVNSTWRIVVTTISQKFCQLTFVNRHPFTTDHPLSDVIPLNGCLENSQELFGSLDYFPCVRFQFKGTRLEDERLQEFFSLYGPFIVSLHLWVVTPEVVDGQMKSLNRLLTQQAPNVTDLKLDYLRIRPEVGSSSVCLFDLNGQAKLPHLQTLEHNALERNEQAKIVEEIIAAAPNLQTYNIPDGLQSQVPLDMLRAKDKIHTLKSLWVPVISYVGLNDIDLYEKFADMQPTLQSFSNRHHYYHPMKSNDERLSRMAVVINKILESSKSTLTTLEPFNLLLMVPGIQFPVLDKLEKLNVSKRTRGSTLPIFPPGLSLSTTFPSMRKFNLDLELLACTDFWSSLFPFSIDENSWPSVHALTINSCFAKYIYNVSLLFPNLKNLVVRGRFANFPLILRGIFEHMKGLECLEFNGVDFTWCGLRYTSIDSLLTGFSPAICHRLARSEEVLDNEEVEKLRENLSILELKGLKSLKLSFRIFGPLTLSRVSHIYAFQRMSRLHVTVTANRSDNESENRRTQDALNVIAPFVHSVE